MAVRENQGLQISLIIFALLMIVTGVCAFMFFRWYEEALLASKAAVEEKKKALTAQLAAEDETKATKKFYGSSETDSLEVLKNNFDEDMKDYGGNLKDSEKDYRHLVKDLHRQMLAAQSTFVDDKVREKELEAKIAAEFKVKEAELAKYKENLDKVAADLKQERDTFNESVKDIENGKTEIAKQISVKQKDGDERLKKATDENTSLVSSVERLRRQVEGMLEIKTSKDKIVDLPRGKITWVDQREHVVWINVGPADGLHRQVTFKVLGPNEPSLVEAKSKASVEVVRMLDDHLAEARIVKDNLSDPIMPGDQIFSQAWSAGHVEHFALNGFMDVNGDGVSDRQLIKNLIAGSNGAVDAEVTDEGKRVGDMSLNTGYLLLGERPSDKGTSAEFLKAYSEMLSEAKAMGIRTMRIEDFLNNVGYIPEEQSVAMDKNAVPTDFKAKPRDGVVRKSNAQFTPRKPHPVSSKPSAY